MSEAALERGHRGILGESGGMGDEFFCRQELRVTPRMTEMATPHTLEGLMKWAQRDEWRGVLAGVLEQHLGPACKGAGVDVGDLADLIGRGWLMTLWGCAFEDLVSRTLDDGRNLADEYLKRRGWKETVSTRAYITALRSSIVSLYEVSDIVVGARLSCQGPDPQTESRCVLRRSQRRTASRSGTASLHG